MSLMRAASAEAKAREKRERELRKAFDVFDSDKSGSLSVEELRAVLMRPGGGHAMTIEQVQAIIDEFDTNKDGELQFEEFSAWWAPEQPASGQHS